MFKITPVQTKEEQRQIANSLGVTYFESDFAYKMFDLESDELLGFSQFEIVGPFGVLHTLAEPKDKNDFEAMFILGRQTMNFIDLCGAHRMVAKECAAEERLLLAIGFRKVDGEYSVDMNGMFDGHCSGHAVKLENP